MAHTFERRTSSYLEIFKAAWENRDRLGYAWRILTDGVCDGCALGTVGMRDWTMSGIHLCWIRLNLLRLNTMPPFDPTLLHDLSVLEKKSEMELRRLGRLPVPFIRRRGESGFQPIAWEEALDLIAERIRRTEPNRVAFYLTSRGTVNETYYVAQKVARFLGTNHIDNSARVCHAPSTTGLKATIGYAATTCNYKDVIGSDLLVFIGSDVANNQPVFMKYVHMAKKQGTKVAVINPHQEPGMEKYWIPSSIDSALFGTKVTDAFFQINVGGDIAFLNGVLKHLIANGWVDEKFIGEHTTGWDELVQALESQSFEELEHYSGASRETMLKFARMYAQAKTAIFVWSMGVTMHRHGVSNVKAIVNLALARGMVGRPQTGLMPIRGHSGVQGGAEMGAVPNQFPGGVPVNEENAAKFSAIWGFEVPAWKGYFVAEMIEAADRGELDVLYSVGSNLFGVLPDSRYTRKAIEKIPLRVHHDIVLNPQMLVESTDTVILLPATTRYEMVGGNTETSTERRIIFSPEIPGPRLPEARDEWRVLIEIARRVKPSADSGNRAAENRRGEWESGRVGEEPLTINHQPSPTHPSPLTTQEGGSLWFASTPQIREEIAKAVPFYEGILHLQKKGDQVQWGGERLCEGGQFGTADGKARFTPLTPPQREIPEGWFRLTTRRGKQFNSMVFGKRDTLAGGDRDAVLLSPQDMERLGLREGEPVTVRSRTGEFRGRIRSANLQPGTLMMYWPEANVLIQRGVCDPECGIPAYRDEAVEVVKE